MPCRKKNVTAAVVFSAFICFGVMSSCNKPKQEPIAKDATGSTPSSVAQPKVSLMVPAAEQVIGRWARTDGIYILEIKTVPDTGYPEVAYFNPDTIKIGNAQVVKRDGTVHVYVKLNDPEKGYPGSYYQLVYNKESDMLEGIYFHATSNQEYPIAFGREK